MSTTNKDEKKDPVVALLQDKLAEDSKNELIKMMLYCNTSGSGLKRTDDVGYAPFVARVSDLATQPYYYGTKDTRKFNYEGSELPTKSVAMTTRSSFVIAQCLNYLDALNHAKLCFSITNERGVAWPSKDVVESIKNQFGEDVKPNLSFIKSMRTYIRKMLIEKLPTLLDECYEALYNNKGNFSYVLTEVKISSVYRDVAKAMTDFVKETQIDTISGSDNTDIYTSVYSKALKNFTTGNATRLVFYDSAWVNVVTTSSAAAEPKLPFRFIKLVKVICARIGKILKSPEASIGDDKNRRTVAWGFLKSFGAVTTVTRLNEQGDTEYFNDVFKPEYRDIVNLKASKKDFQLALYNYLTDLFIIRRDASITFATGLGKPAADYIRNAAITLVRELLFYSESIMFSKPLVFADVFEETVGQINDGVGNTLYSFRPTYTKGDLRRAVESLESRTGSLSSRCIDTLLRFMNVHSQSLEYHTRKTLPLSLELAFLRHGDITRFMTTPGKKGYSDVNLILSPDAISQYGSYASAGNQNSYARFANPLLQDLSSGKPKYGLLHGGVMTFKSTIKDKTLKPDAMFPDKGETTNPIALQFLKEINVLTDISWIYTNTYVEQFEAIKASIQAQIAMVEKQRKQGFNVGPAQVYVQPTFSPTANVNVMNNMMSPQVAVGQSPVVGGQSPVVQVPHMHADHVQHSGVTHGGHVDQGYIGLAPGNTQFTSVLPQPGQQQYSQPVGSGSLQQQYSQPVGSGSLQQQYDQQVRSRPTTPTSQRSQQQPLQQQYDQQVRSRPTTPTYQYNQQPTLPQYPQQPTLPQYPQQQAGSRPLSPAPQYLDQSVTSPVVTGNTDAQDDLFN